MLRTRPAMAVLIAALVVLLVARWSGSGDRSIAELPAPGAPRATTAAGPVRQPGDVPATTIYLGGRDPVGVALPAGAVRTVPVPVEGAAEIVQLPGATIVLAGGTAWIIPPERARARQLGTASAVLAAPEPGRAWLVAPGGLGGYGLTEVRLADGRVLATKGLPSWAPPVAVTSAGIVTRDLVRGGLELRDTPDLRHRVELTADGSFADAYGTLVAWVGARGLHLRDLRSGRERLVRPPGNSRAWLVYGPSARVACCHRIGAFSPDGRTLALYTEVEGPGSPGLVLVDVAEATATPVQGSADAIPAGCGRCLSWHPGGDWLFYLGVTPWTVGAYHRGDDTALPLALDLAGPGLAPPDGLAAA